MSFETLGAISHGEFVEGDALELLSPDEQQHRSRIPHPARRSRWLFGRLAAKHLFLSALHRAPGAGGSRICKVSPAALEAFPEWAYRAIEILPSPPGLRGPSRLRWAGRTHPIHVSISHTSRFSVACLDSVGVGVDAELPMPRCAAFYRINFSQSERLWAESASDVERAYTLLWCLKESALKASESQRISLWRIPHVEVRLRCPPAQVAGVLSPGDTTGTMLVSEAEIRRDQETRTAKVAAAAFAGAILTSLKMHSEEK